LPPLYRVQAACEAYPLSYKMDIGGGIIPEGKAIPVNRPQRPTGVFPVRYGYSLHIKTKSIPVRGP
jgi:hypothetical protein